MKIFYTMHNWNRFRSMIFLWILFKMSRPLAQMTGNEDVDPSSGSKNKKA